MIMRRACRTALVQAWLVVYIISILGQFDGSVSYPGRLAKGCTDTRGGYGYWTFTCQGEGSDYRQEQVDPHDGD